METLETSRLRLLPLTRADYPELIALYAKPAVMRLITPGGRSELATREFLDRLLAQAERLGFGNFVLRERSGGALAGDALLIERTPGAPIELGYALDEPFWGRGYATEAGRALIDLAFGPLALPRLIAVVHEHNQVSIRVLKKLGMREAGRSPREEGGSNLTFELERGWLAGGSAQR